MDEKYPFLGGGGVGAGGAGGASSVVVMVVVGWLEVLSRFGSTLAEGNTAPSGNFFLCIINILMRGFTSSQSKITYHDLE